MNVEAFATATRPLDLAQIVAIKPNGGARMK